MASYQDLAAADVDTRSALAIMQADMEAALQNKQHASVDVNVNVNLNVSGNGKPIGSVKSRNETGSRVLDEAQVSRVIEMAWEDRTPFAAIEHSYGLNEAAVIRLMRHELKPSSFRSWRQRVTNRATKHQAKRSFAVGRAYCKTQYKQR